MVSACPQNGTGVLKGLPQLTTNLHQVKLLAAWTHVFQWKVHAWDYSVVWFFFLVNNINISEKSDVFVPVPFPRVKSPPWHMKSLITRWNEEPLKCRGFPDLPVPFSPVQRHRKFSAVLGTTSERSYTIHTGCGKKSGDNRSSSSKSYAREDVRREGNKKRSEQQEEQQSFKY